MWWECCATKTDEQPPLQLPRSPAEHVMQWHLTRALQSFNGPYSEHEKPCHSSAGLYRKMLDKEKEHLIKPKTLWLIAPNLCISGTGNGGGSLPNEKNNQQIPLRGRRGLVISCLRCRLGLCLRQKMWKPWPFGSSLSFPIGLIPFISGPLLNQSWFSHVITSDIPLGFWLDFPSAVDNHWYLGRKNPTNQLS